MVSSSSIEILSPATVLLPPRFDNTAILLLSSVVLVFVFVLTLVFGIIRIVKTAPNRVISTTIAPNVLIDTDELVNNAPTVSARDNPDTFAVAEDIIKLSVELIFILFAILATLVLFRYVKAKYASVPTREDAS